LNQSLSIFFSIFDQFFLLFVFIHIKTGAVFFADFFRYSNLSISSFSHKIDKKSLSAHGL
jgi:hypothetical protein